MNFFKHLSSESSPGMLVVVHIIIGCHTRAELLAICCWAAIAYCLFPLLSENELLWHMVLIQKAFDSILNSSAREMSIRMCQQMCNNVSMCVDVRILISECCPSIGIRIRGGRKKKTADTALWHTGSM